MLDYEKEIEKIKGIGHKKYNTFLLGALIGVILPLFFVFCYWMWSYRFMDFAPQFFKYLIKGKVLAPVLSLSVIPNLGAFFLFLNKERYKTGRGIILATIVYGCIIMYLKIVVEDTMY